MLGDRLRNFTLATALLIFGGTACATPLADRSPASVSADLRALLSKHDEWRTIPIDPEAPSPSGLATSKTWKIGVEGGRFLLKERTRLTIKSGAGGKTWGQGEIDLSDG